LSANPAGRQRRLLLELPSKNSDCTLSVPSQASGSAPQ
jgi:hypothetical protein